MEPLEDPVRRPSNSADWTIARLVPIVVIIVALVVVAGLVGYSSGEHHSSVTVRTGIAYSSPLQIEATANGWVYDIPLTVTWFSADRTMNDGSRPACLQPGAHSRVQFGSVTVTLQSSTWRPVVWVRCSASKGRSSPLVPTEHLTSSRAPCPHQPRLVAARQIFRPRP